MKVIDIPVVEASYRLITALYIALQDDYRKKFGRYLPFDEYYGEDFDEHIKKLKTALKTGVEAEEFIPLGEINPDDDI